MTPLETFVACFALAVMGWAVWTHPAVVASRHVLREAVRRSTVTALVRLARRLGYRVRGVTFEDNLYLDFNPNELITYDPETDDYRVTGFAIMPLWRLRQLGDAHGFTIERTGTSHPLRYHL